jgi:hypothetical protein
MEEFLLILLKNWLKNSMIVITQKQFVTSKLATHFITNNCFLKNKIKFIYKF